VRHVVEQLGFSDAVVRGLVKAHLARVESAERLRDPFADTPASPHLRHRSRRTRTRRSPQSAR
jgi:hypothetical protein